MYIRVCNAITERDIGGAAAEGGTSLRQLRERLGVAACCGRCADCASGVLQESMRHHALPSSAATQRCAAA